MKARVLLAPLALIAAILPHAAQAKLYGVIFEIKVDDRGTITELAVSKVIDPDSGRTDAVPGIPVSDAYIKAAREAFIAKHNGKSTPGYTYFFMDTDRPDMLARP